MLEPEKHNALGTFREVRDPGLLRVQSQPESVQDRRRLGPSRLLVGATVVS